MDFVDERHATVAASDVAKGGAGGRSVPSGTFMGAAQ